MAHHDSRLLLALRKALGWLQFISTLTDRHFHRRIWTLMLRGLRVCIGLLLGHAEFARKCEQSSADSGLALPVEDILRTAGRGKSRPANPSVHSPTFVCALEDPASGGSTSQHVSVLVPVPSWQISRQPGCSDFSSTVPLQPPSPQTSFPGRTPVEQAEQPQLKGQLTNSKPVIPDAMQRYSKKINVYVV
jgi:hypothetical protein